MSGSLEPPQAPATQVMAASSLNLLESVLDPRLLFERERQESHHFAPLLLL